MKKIYKNILGVILAVFCVSVFVAPAFAVGVNIQAIENAFTPAKPQYTAVFNSSGAYLPKGNLVQIIDAGANGAIDLPDASKANYIGGDDSIIASIVIGVGTGKDGSFSSNQGNIGNAGNVTIYVRAWEGASLTLTTKYGNSTTKLISGPPAGPVTWNDAPDFATTSTVPVPAPSISITPNPVTQGWPDTGMTISGVLTHFTSASVVVINPSTGITIKSTPSINVADQKITFNIDVASDAPATNRTVKVTTGTEEVTTTLKVTAVSTTQASLVSATPNSGKQGQTLASIEIVGANTHFNSTSTIEFGAGITAGSINVTNATHLTVSNVVIAATAAAGLRNVKVTTGTEVATGDVFTVTSVSTATAVVIDDYEGVEVAYPGGYYTNLRKDANDAQLTLLSSDKHEGSYSIKTIFSGIADPAQSWRGWGAIFNNGTKDISNTENITFWMKGDGSANKIKFQLKDKDGDNYAIADADAIALTSTTWQKYSIPISKISVRIPEGSDAGSNSSLDLTKISQYQFVFVGTGASTGILIDYIVAEKTVTPPTAEADPVITSIDPTSGPLGTTVNIVGSHFGTSGSVQIFKNQVLETTIQSAATADASGTVWNAAKVTFVVPSNITVGEKTIKITRADGKSTLPIVFTVTSTSAATTGSYNYPNPFNPFGKESTRIVFNPNGATQANAYIFDSTARVVQKIVWTSVGTNEISWDGKNTFSEIQGDGVYPYRVVDPSNKVLGKGKILVINK